MNLKQIINLYIIPGALAGLVNCAGTQPKPDKEVNIPIVKIEKDLDVRQPCKSKNVINQPEVILEVEYGGMKKTLHCKNGQPEGKGFGWYPNGQKSYERNFVDGKPEGKQLDWFYTGQINFETNFVNGLEEEGKQFRWYENGQKKWEFNTVKGKKEGKQFEWYENGQKWREAIYKNDNLVSEQCWDEKGKTKECY